MYPSARPNGPYPVHLPVAYRTWLNERVEQRGLDALDLFHYWRAWPVNLRLSSVCQDAAHDLCRGERVILNPGQPDWQCRCLCHQRPRGPVAAEQPDRHAVTGDPALDVPCTYCGADAGEPCGPDCAAHFGPAERSPAELNARLWAGYAADEAEYQHAEQISIDEDGFTLRRRPDGMTAEFGPGHDRLTEWQVDD